MWPLVAWLLLTRRYRAALWSALAATSLLVGAWAVIGFQGLHDYPALLRIVQDVYAVRSVSLATAAAALGASGADRNRVRGVRGRRIARSRRMRRSSHRWRPTGAFALVVGACIVASPIVWPNYLALLFVPIAITWPRLAPVWCFGYVTSIMNVMVPKPAVAEACCASPGVPEQAWAHSHADPAFWYAAGSVALVLVVSALVAISSPAWAGRSRAGVEPTATTVRPHGGLVRRS